MSPGPDKLWHTQFFSESALGLLMVTILITGTNRGIGLEFTKQYLVKGFHVIATCRNPHNAETLSSLDVGQGKLEVLQLDVSDRDSMDTFADRLDNTAIDIFINNAGVYGPDNLHFGNVDAETWLSVLQVNTLAPLLLTQLLMPRLLAGEDKKLIYISSKVGSIADNRGGAGYMYRSSKAALNQVVKSLSIDLAGDGFIAAVLHPGWVLTDMGGPNALIDTQTSVAGLMQVIDSLGSWQNGTFINYDGAEIPW